MIAQSFFLFLLFILLGQTNCYAERVEKCTDLTSRLRTIQPFSTQSTLLNDSSRKLGGKGLKLSHLHLLCRHFIQTYCVEPHRSHLQKKILFNFYLNYYLFLICLGSFTVFSALTVISYLNTSQRMFEDIKKLSYSIQHLDVSVSSFSSPLSSAICSQLDSRGRLLCSSGWQ